MGGAQYDCGVIHNQSQVDVVYLLITDKLSVAEVAALTKLTTEEMKQLIMPTGGTFDNIKVTTDSINRWSKN